MRLGAPTMAVLVFAGLVLVPATERLIAPAAEAQTTTPTFEAKIKGSAFQPSVITILKGTLVKWTNEDSGAGAMHSVTNDEGQTPAFDKNVFPAEFKGTVLNPQSQTFNALGTTKYHCKYHASMHGEVRVVSSFTTPFVDVVAKDNGGSNRFDPASIKINITQKVNFTNGGTLVHNVQFEDASLGKVGELPAGSTTPITVTFPKNGLFKYRCTYHAADFTTGMKGEVLVGESGGTKAAPLITIASPTAGAKVKGTLEVNGEATQGTGGVNVTKVEVRIGAAGTWTEATLAGNAWKLSWDSTKAADGATTVYARALSVEFPDPAPATVDVVVENGAGSSSTSSAPTASSGKSDGGGIPGFESSIVLAALALMAAIVGRRRP